MSKGQRQQQREVLKSVTSDIYSLKPYQRRYVLGQVIACFETYVDYDMIKGAIKRRPSWFRSIVELEEKQEKYERRSRDLKAVLRELVREESDRHNAKLKNLREEVTSILKKSEDKYEKEKKEKKEKKKREKEQREKEEVVEAFEVVSLEEQETVQAVDTKQVQEQEAKNAIAEFVTEWIKLREAVGISKKADDNVDTEQVQEQGAKGKEGDIRDIIAEFIAELRAVREEVMRISKKPEPGIDYEEEDVKESVKNTEVDVSVTEELTSSEVPTNTTPLNSTQLLTDTQAVSNVTSIESDTRTTREQYNSDNDSGAISDGSWVVAEEPQPEPEDGTER